MRDADVDDRVMKKTREKNNEMLREYDFSQGYVASTRGVTQKAATSSCWRPM
jgi:hypothetical protein